jgi:hypothetical protein
MMAGTAGDEVLFKGRGFKTVLQELFEGALIFAGAGLLYEGFRSMAGRPGEAILMVLIGLAMFYLTFIKGTIGHRKRITVYRSGIDVNGSYVMWEVESVDGRRLTFRLKKKDFQKFLNAVEEALGSEEIEKRVRKR